MSVTYVILNAGYRAKQPGLFTTTNLLIIQLRACGANLSDKVVVIFMGPSAAGINMTSVHDSHQAARSGDPILPTN